jgi:hypothetical protein
VDISSQLPWSSCCCRREIHEEEEEEEDDDDSTECCCCRRLLQSLQKESIIDGVDVIINADAPAATAEAGQAILLRALISSWMEI